MERNKNNIFEWALASVKAVTTVALLLGLIVLGGCVGVPLNPVGISANIQFGKTWQNLFAAVAATGPNYVRFSNPHRDLVIEVEVETGYRTRLDPGASSRAIPFDPFDRLGNGRTYSAVVTYHQLIPSGNTLVPRKVRIQTIKFTFCFDCPPYAPGIWISTRSAGPYEIPL